MQRPSLLTTELHFASLMSPLVATMASGAQTVFGSHSASTGTASAKSAFGTQCPPPQIASGQAGNVLGSTSGWPVQDTDVLPPWLMGPEPPEAEVPPIGAPPPTGALPPAVGAPPTV